MSLSTSSATNSPLMAGLSRTGSDDVGSSSRTGMGEFLLNGTTESTTHDHDHHDHDDDDPDKMAELHLDGGDSFAPSIGVLSASPEPNLPGTSNSPLLLSTTAPIIGDMPGLEDSMGNSFAASGSLVNDHSPAKEAVSRVHSELESLEEMKRKLEADLEAELKKKKAHHKGKKGKGKAHSIKPPKIAVKKTTSILTTINGNSTSLQDSTNSTLPISTTATTSTPPVKPEHVGIQSHASERRNALAQHLATSAANAAAAAGLNVGGAGAASSFQPSALLPPGILSSTDLVQLTSVMEALSNMITPQNRANILPRYLGLSLAQIEKEIAYLDGDLSKKRQRYAQMITSSGHVSHRKGAAAALAAAAAGYDPPDDGSLKKRKHSFHHRANPVNMNGDSIHATRRTPPAPRMLPSGNLSQPGVGRGNAHPAKKSFSPAATPTIGQIVCLCKQPYDGTPVGPTYQSKADNTTNSTHVHTATITTNGTGDTIVESESVKQEGLTTPPSTTTDPSTTPNDSTKPTPPSNDAPMTDVTDAASSVNINPPTTTTTTTAMDIDPVTAKTEPSTSDPTPMTDTTSNDPPNNDPASALSSPSSTMSTPTPPLPYLIPCQRCPRWFHPTCLRLSALEALTPFICAKHAADAPVPPLRALTRPTHARHERAAEKEKAAAAAAADPNAIAAVQKPGSPYYLPDALTPCPPLPDELDDTRDPRLFTALRDMMQVYHLSQHDVCISSNLSGGQAALSSLINARKIANVGRKQNQLRRWLWKFEEWQRARVAHIAALAELPVRPPPPRPNVLPSPLPPETTPLAPDGTPLAAGCIIAGHTTEWPPSITWKSYFAPLTPEELAKENARKEAQKLMQQRIRSSNGLSSSVPAASSSNLGSPTSSQLSSSVPTSTDPPTRLRREHHPPLKYISSPEPEPDDERPARINHKRKSAELDPADDGMFSNQPSSKYSVGDRIDARVTPLPDAPWLTSTVKAIRPGALLVHFSRTSEQYDQWLAVPSRRVCVYGIQSTEKKRQAARAGWNVEVVVKNAFKAYKAAEKLAIKDGITTGAPGWSGKKLTGSAAAAAAAAAARRKEESMSDDEEEEEEVNTNADECGVCGKGGNLLCCDGCPGSYHGGCCDPPVNMKQLANSEEEWYCMNCTAKKKRKMA